MRTPALAMTLIVLAVAPCVEAAHPDPGPKAKKIVADLVMAYEPCTLPDTATDGFGWDACATPVRSDPGCGFGPRGRGKLKIAVSSAHMNVVLTLRGLDAGCEGSTIALILPWRATGDDCGGSPCTLTDDFTPSWSACTVINGKCTIPPTGSAFTFLPAGARTGVELRGADIIRDGTLRPFTMGFVLP